MKNYELKATAIPELFRVVDREGDWTHYFHQPSGKYLKAVNAILDGGYAKGRRFYEYLKNITPEEAERKLKVAGDRGDAVHQSIFLILDAKKVKKDELQILAEDNITLRPVTDSEWDCLLAFAEFIKRHNAEVILKEYPVFHLLRGYAGTLDAVLILHKACEVKACPCKPFIGKVGLYDWKTSGSIYESYGAQVASYANAQNLDCSVEYTAILRIGTNHKTTGGYELDIYGAVETQTHWEEFLAAMKIAEASSKPFDPEKEIREIPDEIDITITAEVVEPQKIEEHKDENDTRSDEKAGGRSKARARTKGSRPRAKGQKGKPKSHPADHGTAQS